MTLENYLKIKSRKEVNPRGDLERSGKAGRGLTSRSDFKNLTKYFFAVFTILFLFFTIGNNYVHASTIFRAPSVDGLVGYWNFDTQAGGINVVDLSGQGNNGTMINMDPATDWVDGKVGSGALDFDGSNDVVNVEHNSSLNVDKITISSWIYLRNSNLSMIISKYAGTTYNWQLYFDTSRKMNFYAPNIGNDIDTSIIPLNTWTHVAVTYDKTNVAFYVEL